MNLKSRFVFNLISSIFIKEFGSLEDFRILVKESCLVELLGQEQDQAEIGVSISILFLRFSSKVSAS